MKTAQYTGKRAVEIIEVDAPKPEPGWAIVDVKANGVFGSDLPQERGEWPLRGFAAGPGLAAGNTTCCAGGPVPARLVHPGRRNDTATGRA